MIQSYTYYLRRQQVVSDEESLLTDSSLFLLLISLKVQQKEASVEKGAMLFTLIYIHQDDHDVGRVEKTGLQVNRDNGY